MIKVQDSDADNYYYLLTLVATIQWKIIIDLFWKCVAPCQGMAQSFRLFNRLTTKGF